MKTTKKKACERIQGLSKEEKENKKKQQYGCEQHKNLAEDEKQNLFEYRTKNKMRRNALL